jgi:hypothetical protein
VARFPTNLHNVTKKKTGGEGVLVPENCNICSREGVNSSEEGVAGWVVFKEFSVKHSFTLETSMCGTTHGHFDESDYESIGFAFCEAIIETFIHHTPERSANSSPELDLSMSQRSFMNDLDQ